MGVTLREEDVDQAVQWAQHLITPPQQRLPDDLTDLLQGAVTAWESDQPDEANDLLHEAFQLAHTMGYV